MTMSVIYELHFRMPYDRFKVDFLAHYPHSTRTGYMMRGLKTLTGFVRSPDAIAILAPTG